MKKIMSIALAMSIPLFLAACRAGNTGMRNGNNNASNSGTATNQGNTAGLQNSNFNNNNNANLKDGTYTGTSDGNERATVVVRNGRITDIDLNRADDNTGNAAGFGEKNNLTGIGKGRNFMWRDDIEDVANAGRATDLGINNTGYGANGGVGDAINTDRTNLINAMIQNQRSDVYIDTHDDASRTAVDNWKQAVSRALDQARR